jgi:hypothetical protein
MPYGGDMDVGRTILGASTVGAVVLAVGLGVAVTPGSGLSTNDLGGGVCGTYPDDATSAAAWFLAEFHNDTGHGVRVRSARAAELHDVTLSHLAIATAPSEHSSGLVVTDDPDHPEDYGRTVPVDSGFVVPAHGELDVVGRIVLRDGADAGRVRGLVVTTAGPLGTVRTVTDPASFGVGIGTGHAESEIGCIGA